MTVKIAYGITGNYYAISPTEEELVEVCQLIGKSPTSVRWNKEYRTWCFRVKQKTHKQKLKELAGLDCLNNLN